MADIKHYIRESYDELVHKVTWPTWSELQSSSVVVLITSFLIAMIIFLMDYVFGVNAETSFWKGVLGWLYDLVSPS